MSTLDRPRIGRPNGSTVASKQARAVRTREAILAVAARHFDSGGFADTSINLILDTGGFTKGAIYYHFPTKEAVAQQLVDDWNLAVDAAFNSGTSRGSSASVQLAEIFADLARQISADTTLRAGMKLTLDPATGGDISAFTHWVDATENVVNDAITRGELDDNATVRHLGWNLCAGTVGISNAAATLGSDTDLASRIGEIITAHLTAAARPE